MSLQFRNNLPKRWIGMVLLGVLGLWGCLSEISLEVPETNSDSIAIRGKVLYGDTSFVRVEITKVSDFTASDIPEAIIGATVELMNDNGQRIQLYTLDNGVYGRGIPASDPGFLLEPGRSYRLLVLSPNGKQYISREEPLHTVPEASGLRQDTIQREIINNAGNLVEQDYLRFLVTTPLSTAENSERVRFKWNFTGTYRFMESNVSSPFPNTRTCYFTDVLDLEHVVVYNGLESGQDVLTDYFLLEEELNYRFTDGFYLTAIQESLSEGAYRYWESASRVVNLTGNFFEAPPGKVQGNFYNPEDPDEEVFGYFYATQQDTVRLYVPPGDKPVRQFCPLEASPADDSVSPVCFDCQSRRGSTLEKPDFWVE